MARIRHMAVKTADVSKLADFYKNVFGLREVSRGKRSIYLSDGYINMAILPAEDGQEGIDHFGFEVEDLQKMANSALEAGAQQGPRDLPRDGRFAEVFIKDPTGQRVDLSKQGWKI
ncbi:MAG TPA: VOC family protein [Candidatus Binatia bacterium]|nr:VOC family protein [Candidatus Binatia bacterium]